MDTKTLTKWTGEQLHGLLGFRDRNLADFLVSLASTARSSDELCDRLRENGVPEGDDTSSFARQLFTRANPAGGAVASSSCSSSASQSRTTQASSIASGSSNSRSNSNAAAVRKSQSYRLLDDSDSDNDHAMGNSDGNGSGTAHQTVSKEKDKSKSKKSRKDKDTDKEKNKRRIRDKDIQGGSSSEDDTQIHRKRPHTHTKNHDDDAGHIETSQYKNETIEEAEERKQAEALAADIEERDALVHRMRERERIKSGNKSASTSSAGDEEPISASKAVDISDRSTVSALREASRQHYLQKREEQQLKLLEASIIDEERMFSGQNLSSEEKQRLELNKRILAVAKDKKTFSDKDVGYVLPSGSTLEAEDIEAAGSNMSVESKREAVLHARYIEEKGLTEQQVWEADQLAKQNHGKTKEPIVDPEQQQYNYILENSIEFVSLEVLKGTRTLQQVQEQEKEEQKQALLDSETVRLNALLAPKPMTAHEKILQGRANLPVARRREDFLNAVRANRILVVVGETGSGKTTQLTQFLHEAGWSKHGKIGCTQPRRVAAMSVAARVASEMDVKVGQEVGYSIRFEDCTSDSTVIKYMTDGMLLREFLTEPDLASYSCLMIDEAHERTLHTDVLFGLVKDISRFRGDDFRLIISSATMDAEKFATYFNAPEPFIIEGRTFHVNEFYTKSPEAHYVEACVTTVLHIHVTQAIDGDILVFLTGQEEIEECADALMKRTKGLGNRIPELLICPIYSALPPEMQAKIFDPTPKGSRKVVLATNIAETSLTINGICYVIDPGFAKQKSYNPKTGMESLLVTAISRAAANQRKGRAGRTQAGSCFRLYTKWSFENELESNTIPEIQRTNMGNVVLMLKSLGIDDLLHFDFMDPPPPETLMRALEQLYALGALNSNGDLTKLGRRMAEFPLDPMLSKALLASETYKCTTEILTILAMISQGGSIFYIPKDKVIHAENAKINFARGGGGDHLALLRVYQQWECAGFSSQWCYDNFVQSRSLNKARDVREQLVGLCDRVEVEEVSCGAEVKSICMSLCAGFFFHAAKYSRTGDYKTVKQQNTVYIHPSSVMAKDEEPAKWVLYHELTFTTKEYMRTVSPMEGSWLTEIAPHYYQKADVEEVTKKIPHSKAVGRSAA